MGDGEAAFRFSTSDHPERQRRAALRDLLGRDVLRLDLEPLIDDAFFADVTGNRCAGLDIFTVATSPVRSGRTRALLADGDDSLCLQQVSTRVRVATGRGRELTIGPGEAVLVSRADATSTAIPSACRITAMHVPRVAIEPLLRPSARAAVHPIPAQSEPLRLLNHFLLAVRDTGPPLSSELQRLSANYVYDLLALALGPTPDVAELASRRGLRVARLRAIKDSVIADLHRPDLTVTGVAKRHRLTPRYVQRLFETDGTTFTDFVREQRLEKARRLLINPAHAGTAIGTIALDAGFTDQSHFNHAFRRTYGMTPSDARRAAGR